jgi:hypothetical protein
MRKIAIEAPGARRTEFCLRGFPSGDGPGRHRLSGFQIHPVFSVNSVSLWPTRFQMFFAMRTMGSDSPSPSGTETFSSSTYPLAA